MKKFILLSLTAITMMFMLGFISKQTEKAGVAQFLRNPNNYTFKCGCDLGEVLTASLDERSNMLVKYYYMCGGKKLHGVLVGKYDKDTNHFEGTYNTENKLFFGPINFSFNEQGEGTGNWDNGVGTVAMLLKEIVNTSK